jgi:transposase-like protein
LPVTTCPFCQRVDIRLVFEADDGLKSYTCHACTRTFHVTELQLAEPETVKSSEPRPEKSGQGPKKR